MGSEQDAVAEALFDACPNGCHFAPRGPLTAWVMDYPIFERLHYLLVAGYNVYGKAQHQILR